MANEPERPIEKLLRAAAKRRRDEAGAPLELHPATRRLLHGEVTRTFAKPGREPRSFIEVLGQLWPRVAWGLAIFAVLAVVGYALLPLPGKGKPEAMLAKSEPMSRAVPTTAPLPPPVATTPAPPAAAVESNPSAVAPAATPPTARADAARQLGAVRQPLAKDSLAMPADREAKEQPAPVAAPQLADRRKAADAKVAASGGIAGQAHAGTVNGTYQPRLGLANKSAPLASEPAVPAAPAPVPMTTAASSVVAADKPAKLPSEKADQPMVAFKSLPSVAAANRPKAPPAATDGLLRFAEASRTETGSAGITQQFAQAALRANAKSTMADKATPAQSVLASFQVEQTGTDLRIIDGDGSVYSGYLRLADAVRRQRSAKTEAPAASPAPAVGGVLEERSAARLDSNQLTLQTYSFRVVGTNRSLHKKVVFTGNLTATTNAPAVHSFTNLLSFGGGLGARLTGSTQTNLLPLLNLRISGKVVVGNGKAVEIDALPTSP
jgi:hypothetical protein